MKVKGLNKWEQLHSFFLGQCFIVYTDLKRSGTKAGTKMRIELKHEEDLPTSTSTYTAAIKKCLSPEFFQDTKINYHNSPFLGFFLNNSTHKNFINHFVQ